MEGSIAANSRQLRQRLRTYGLSDEVVNMAWPSWWSDEAESSASAQAELRFTLARRLGLDARALLQDDPRFICSVATFKHLGVVSRIERDAIVSYGTSVATALLSAIGDSVDATAANMTAASIRARVLASSSYVSLADIITFCWAIGVPVVQLQVFPLGAKRMCAMVAKVRNRYAILLARESKFPAQLAYYVAHELGHIALGHLSSSPALVDVEDPLRVNTRDDPEEELADRYALELLTGMSEPKVITEESRYSAAALANVARNVGPQLNIDPGTLVLCFGHSTGRWDKAIPALQQIYPQGQSVGSIINDVAVSQLATHSLSDDTADYILAVIGKI